MSEINRVDLVSDDAINAPLLMAKNFDVLAKSISNALSLGKGAETAATTAKSTEGLTKSTKELTLAQVELMKVQKATETATARGTDEYIKAQKALDNVTRSNKEKKAAVDDNSRSVNTQTSSYTQLNAALTKNRKIYQDLTGDQQRNSIQGKELLKIIQSQNKDFKGLASTMGITTVQVGNYKEEVEKALGVLRKVGPEAVEAVELGIGKFTLLQKLVSGPVLGTFAALFILVGSLKKGFDEYTESTAEGAKKLKELKVDYQVLSELGRESLIIVGKGVSNFLGSIQKLISYTIEGLASITNSEALLNFKREQQVNLNKLSVKIKEEEIELIVKGAELELKSAKGLYEARDKIRNTDKERLKQLDITEDAILKKEELESKVLEDNVALQRALILKKGYGIGQSEKALDLLRNEIALGFINREDIEKLAKAEGDLERVKIEFFLRGRRRQALRKSTLDDITKRAVDNYKTELEANDKTQAAILEKDLAVQSLIIGNQNNSLDEQLVALQQSEVNKTKLVQLAADKERRAAADSAFARVESDSKSVKEILDNTALSSDQKLQMLFDEKVKAIKIDKAYNDELNAIDEKASIDSQQIVLDGEHAKVKIIADNFNYFIDLRKSFIERDKNETIKGLNEQLHTGAISLRTYNAQKLRLEQSATKENLENTIKELKDEQKAIQDSLGDRVILTQEESDKLHNIWVRLSESEIQLSNNVAAKDILNSQRRVAFLQGLLNEVGKLVGIINGMYQASSNAKVQQYQDEIQAVQNAADAEVKIEEDKNKKIQETQSESFLKKAIKDEQDNAAKLGYQDSESANRVLNYENELKALQKITSKSDKIKESAAKKEIELNKQIAVEKNAAAIKQHKADVIQASVNFAQAVLLAFTAAPGPLGIALAAITAAVAGVQLAAVIASPVPHFEVGTHSAPGGFAIVGETGSEAIKEPGQPWKLSPSSATMMEVAKGAEIIPHNETVRMLAMASLGGEVLNDRGNRELQTEIKQLRKDLDSHTSRTVKAIQKSGGNLYAQGSLIYKAVEAEDGSKKHIRLKNFSS